MSEKEQKLIAAGKALADSIGHRVGCPKSSPQIPCVCGHGFKQAQALSDWRHLIEEIEHAG